MEDVAADQIITRKINVLLEAVLPADVSGCGPSICLTLAWLDGILWSVLDFLALLECLSG